MTDQTTSSTSSWTRQLRLPLVLGLLVAGLFALGAAVWAPEPADAHGPGFGPGMSFDQDIAFGPDIGVGLGTGPSLVVGPGMDMRPGFVVADGMGRDTHIVLGKLGPVGGEALAEALGITTEELAAAHQAAWAAALSEAVEQGLLTQAQADALANRGPGPMHGRILFRFLGAEIDMEALLAEALGISVDELEAAKEQAFESALSEAVDAGRVTEERAESIRARRALHTYLRDDGFPEQVRALYEEAVQSAVDAGVITQEQADKILEGPAGRGPGGFGGLHRRRGPGRGFGDIPVPGDLEMPGLQDPTSSDSILWLQPFGATG